MAGDGPKGCDHKGFLVVVRYQIQDLPVPLKVLQITQPGDTFITLATAKLIQCFRCGEFFNFSMDPKKMAEKIEEGAEEPGKVN